MRKNLCLAFEEKAMNFKNYFRSIEINEKSVYDDRELK